MSIIESVNDLIDQKGKYQPKRRRDRICIYLEGLKAKRKQAIFALDEIKEAIRNLPIDSTEVEILNEKEIVQLYTDSFWTFLHSNYDIISQVINKLEQLGIGEEHVSFNTVKDNLDSNRPNSDLLKDKFDEIDRSNYYINTVKYRNCSRHRRQIAIKTTTVQEELTTAYDTTGQLPDVNKKCFLCDDPLNINPKFHQERDIIDYSEGALDKSEEHIVDLIEIIS